MLTTDPDDYAVASSGLSADDRPPLTASPECDAVTRLARMHFGVAAALVTLSDAQGPRLQAADGVLPDALPPDLFARSVRVGKPLDTVVVIPNTRDDSRFCIDQQGVAVTWPRFFATCALTAADGRHLGALCLLDDAFRTFDEGQRAFLRELAVLAAQALVRAHKESRTDSYAVEHRIRCKDGTYKWICSRGKVVSKDCDGRARRMVGTTTDVTASRELAAQLQQTIGLITNLTDEVPGLVFQYRESTDGRRFFSYASDGIRDIYEVTPEQVARSAGPIEALIDPCDAAAYRQSLAESAANLTPWHLEYRVRLPRQGLCWRQGDARPQRMPDGSTLWHGFITDSTERKRIEAELHELATIDHLTQLPNRRHFMIQSEAELVRVRRGDSLGAAVLMLDLDHFKALNDRWGHALGDRALSHFARLLRLEVRVSDIVGRLGGEEFAAVLPETDTDAAIALGRRVQRRAAETPLIHGDNCIALAVSIGIDRMRVTDVGAYQALARGDSALYLAKERGRNRIEIYQE